MRSKMPIGAVKRTSPCTQSARDPYETRQLLLQLSENQLITASQPALDPDSSSEAAIRQLTFT